MKQVATYFVFVLVIVGLYGFAFSMSAGDNGKKVYEDKKCGTCHSVNAAGLTSKSPRAIDLSKVGASAKAEVISNYLMKKGEINGKSHKFAFKGNDQELKDLSAWLGSLKK